jgi:hypothetical protein
MPTNAKGYKMTSNNIADRAGWTKEQNADFRAFCRSNDLHDLRGAQFRRLVRLAHSEGLLSEILREDSSPALGQLLGLTTVASVQPMLSRRLLFGCLLNALK